MDYLGLKVVGVASSHENRNRSREAAPTGARL